MRKSILTLLTLGLCACAGSQSNLRPEEVTTAHGKPNPLLQQDKLIRVGQKFEDEVLKVFKKALLREDEKAMLGLFAPDYQATWPNAWSVQETEQVGPSGIATRAILDGEKGNFDAARTVSAFMKYRSGFTSIEDSTVHHISFAECDDDYCSKGYMRFRGKSSGDFPRQDYVEFDTRCKLVKDKFQIVELKLTYGTSTQNRSGKPFFVDSTARSGISFSHVIPKDMDDYNFNLSQWIGSGVSLADVDGDGREDIFLSNMGGSSRLYRNLGKGRFQDATEKSGVILPEGFHTISSIFADFDNDGDKDLLVLSFTGRDIFFENLGKGTFRAKSETGLEGREEDFTVAASLVDFDKDGYLDLYVTEYGNTKREVPETFLYSRNGGKNHLYRNRGNLTFEDVTQKAGVADSGWSLASKFFDYNNDGYQDLFVANDFGLNSLFRGNGDGTFTNTTFETHAVSYGAGMGVTTADINGDGFLDFYVSNIYSNNRWFTKYPSFKRLFVKEFFLRNPLPLKRKLSLFRELGEQFDLSPQSEKAFEANLTDGNEFFYNEGGKAFRDVAWENRTHFAQWAWGADFVDFDNDGDEDIYVVNGFHTGENPEDT